MKRGTHWLGHSLGERAEGVGQRVLLCQVAKVGWEVGLHCAGLPWLTPLPLNSIRRDAVD